MSGPPNETEHLTRLFHTLFTAHPAHIALLDLEGTILAVNEAWMEFGRRNQLDQAYRFLGVGYLAACEPAIQRHDSHAVQAAAGLCAVLAAARSAFTMQYPCHAPWERRWFRLRATLLRPEIPAVLVSHTLLRTAPPDQPDPHEQAASPSPPSPSSYDADGAEAAHESADRRLLCRMWMGL